MIDLSNWGDAKLISVCGKITAFWPLFKSPVPCPYDIVSSFGYFDLSGTGVEELR